MIGADKNSLEYAFGLGRDNTLQSTELGNVANIVMGQAPPSSACSEARIGLPFLQGNAEFGAKHPTAHQFCSAALRKAEVGDILISVRAPVGAVNVADQTYVIGRGLAAIHPAKIYSSFAWHAIRFWSTQLAKVAQGSTFTAIGRQELEKLQIIKFGEDLEKSISIVLETLDEAIEKSEALIAKLKQVRAGMLHDLLTCGLDENGEIRDPEIYPHQFKNSPLGLIPINWELTNLANISEFITSGSRGWASFYSDQGSMFIRIGNLTREHINLRFDDIQYVKPPRSAEGERTKVEGNDLLISITADLGIIGMIPHGFGEAYVNQHIALIRLKPCISFPLWIGHLLSSHRYQKIFQSLNDSGAKAGLNLSTLASLPIALPQSEAEQQKIIEALDALDKNIATQTSALDKLRETKLGLRIRNKISLPFWC